MIFYHADTSDGNPFNINVTMGELYLYFSVWFDNCHEIPSFSPLIHTHGKRKESDQISEEDVKSEGEINHHDRNFDDKVTYDEYVEESPLNTTPSDELGPVSGKDREGARVSGIQPRAGRKPSFGSRSPNRAWDSSESKGDRNGQEDDKNKTSPGKVGLSHCHCFSHHFFHVDNGKN